MKLSYFQNLKMVKITNKKDQIDSDNTSKEIMIYFSDKLDKSFYPGDRIQCAGILLPGTTENLTPKTNSIDFLFQAVYLEKRIYNYSEKMPFLLKKDILSVSRSRRCSPAYAACLNLRASAFGPCRHARSRTALT